MKAKMTAGEKELEALAHSLDDLLTSLERLRQIDPVMAPYCEEATRKLEKFIEVIRGLRSSSNE